MVHSDSLDAFADLAGRLSVPGPDGPRVRFKQEPAAVSTIRRSELEREYAAMVCGSQAYPHYFLYYVQPKDESMEWVRHGQTPSSHTETLSRLRGESAGSFIRRIEKSLRETYPAMDIEPMAPVPEPVQVDF